MKKILILELKSVCYQSYQYFAEKLGTELEKQGCNVTFFRTAETPFEQLEQFCGTSFDAVFEFNSDLPRAQMEDDSYFLDHIDAPFFDIILDHPLYHHESLKQKLSNFHVLCLDQNHKKYIEENYPHIKSVHQIFLSGEESTSYIPLKKRPIDILFTGTYTPANEVWDAVHLAPAFLRKNITDLIDMMLSDSTLTLESAVRKLIPDTDSLIFENFPLHISSFFLVDTYLRAYYREELIKTIVHANLPLTICGANWDKFSLFSAGKDQNITFLPSVSFKDTFALMGQAKITLNLMPLFKQGLHDRIPSSMLNHSVCVTDKTSYLEEHYTHEKELAFYDITNLSTLPGLLTDLLSNSAKAEQISECGYQYAKKYTSWSKIGEMIFSLLP
ncbi:MAG: glycosyltransferase [Lachnospiraceae bacterium]|nr:glycosyltransferase [Lachnospiraceae bacterium]